MSTGTAVRVLAAWCVLSVPIGIAVGKLLRRQQPSETEGT